MPYAIQGSANQLGRSGMIKADSGPACNESRTRRSEDDLMLPREDFEFFPNPVPAPFHERADSL
jgi:hypothetical protein